METNSKPSIVIGVLDGIVTDVYFRPGAANLSAQVLDVDKERGDAGVIQARWDAVAGDPEYQRLGPKFYDPDEG